MYIFVLAWVNVYICRELFFTEFIGHTNSLQGLWIAMARLAREHWYQPAWWPYQDSGMPFEHVYMPLVPALTALYAKVGQCSPMRAFNAITGTFYCLGPLTLFVMAWRMTSAAGYSFWAALAYSLTSPARALLRDPDFHPSLLWTSRRLYTMAVWDDTPHGASVCFLALAILFLWLSLTKRQPRHYLLTGVSMALAVSASVFGAVAILLSVICLLSTLPREKLASNLVLISVIGALAYLAICPFLPPSLIATIRSNQQQYPEDQWSLGSLVGLGFVILGWSVLWWILDRFTRDRLLRFFVLFGYLASSIPMVETYAHRHFLPQAGRYQPEMEMGIALAVIFLVRPMSERLPRGIRAALALLLLSFAGEQIASHRRYAKEIIRGVDVTRSIEYRVAKWFDQNLPGERVMVPGSIAQWFNVFSDAPQLSGASYSTTPNPIQQDAMVNILAGAGPHETAVSILWLKAFGIQAVTVCGKNSTEFWKPYADPKKFEGLLPRLWSEDDVTIYRVPQPTASLARVIPERAVAVSKAQLPELEKYVAALEDPSSPAIETRWDGFRRLSIRTVARKEQVISIPTSYHSGWHAAANGHPAEVRRDGFGFLLVRPACDGPCEIEMTYDGGWEYRLCRWLSALTILGVAAWSMRRLFRRSS